VRSPAPAPHDAITIPIIPLLRAFIALVVLAIVATIGSVVWAHRDQLVGRATVERYVDTSAYQAVFLSGQQVYFGHLRVDGDLYLLSDIYYLSTPDSSGAGGGQLLKRGAEVHGPKEPMIIPASQVLFVENIRDDSPVVVAIHANKSGQGATAPPAPTAPAPTASPSVTPRPSPTR
jgi:hypothetical protein